MALGRPVEMATFFSGAKSPPYILIRTEAPGLRVEIGSHNLCELELRHDHVDAKFIQLKEFDSFRHRTVDPADCTRLHWEDWS